MSEVVHVPVPVDRLQEVYELLAKKPAAPASVHITEEGFPLGWSRGLLDRMFVESSSAMRRILGSIARRSPGWITTSEIAHDCGLTARQVVSSLGPFGKRVRGRYGVTEWPFAAREFVDEGILKYSMSPVVASRILELADELEMHDKDSA